MFFNLGFHPDKRFHLNGIKGAQAHENETRKTMNFQVYMKSLVVLKHNQEEKPEC